MVVTVMMRATATTMAMGEDDHESNVDDGGVDDSMATAMGRMTAAAMVTAMTTATGKGGSDSNGNSNDDGNGKTAMAAAMATATETLTARARATASVRIQRLQTRGRR